MPVISWIPNQNIEYDNIFDKLREQQYQDKSHRYWSNYNKDHFSDTILHSMYFNDNNEIELCSTISTRSCWPENVYRILNRTWKVTNRKTILRQVSKSMGETTINQIQWLKDNTNCKLYFVSRQTDNWVDWVINSFKNDYGIEFLSTKNKYLTCPNECDDTCWQHIIYNGDTSILENWKNK